MLTYPAKISYNRKDRAYLVSFPDFPNVNTFGATVDDAIRQAKEALTLSFEVDFQRGFQMPKPSKPSGINIYMIPLPLHIEVPFRLRQLRGKLTQEQIAKRLKITPQAYQKFEHPGKCNITLRKLEELEDVFNSSFHLLVQERRGRI